MPTLRDLVLPIIANQGWAKVETLGFSPYTVTVRTRTWSGGSVKLGVPTDSDMVLRPNPQVKEQNGDRQLLLYGITPAYAGGGYTPAQLNPSTAAGAEYYYLVAGPNGTHAYVLESIDTSDPVEYTLVLTTLEHPAPF